MLFKHIHAAKMYDLVIICCVEPDQSCYVNTLVGFQLRLSVVHSCFSSDRINLSPFTKDFRGEEHYEYQLIF